MKTNFTNFPRKNFKFLALALFALSLVNCSKNDDGPVTYEFKEFENLSELPDVADPDPEFTEPDLGSINESEAAKAMIADFQDGSGDLSDATKDNLTAVGNFADGLNTDIQDEAQALDAAKIEEILNSTELTGDYAALAAELETLPDNIAALFPSITFSADYNRAQNKSGVVINDLMADLMSQAGTGPCFDMAKAAYDKAMEAPIAKRDEQLASFSSNLDRRMTFVPIRFESRLSIVETKVDFYKTSVIESMISILGLADAVEPAREQQIREYALMYTVQSLYVITTFETEATSLIENRKVEETQTLETIKTEKSNEVQSNFDAVKAEAEALLTAAYNKCHNQGSGS